MRKDKISQDDLVELVKKKINHHFGNARQFGFTQYGYSLYNTGIYFKTFLRSTSQYYIALLSKSSFSITKRHNYKYICRYFNTRRHISFNKALVLFFCESKDKKYDTSCAKFRKKMYDHFSEPFESNHHRNILRSIFIDTMDMNVNIATDESKLNHFGLEN